MMTIHYISNNSFNNKTKNKKIYITYNNLIFILQNHSKNCLF